MAAPRFTEIRGFEDAKIRLQTADTPDLSAPTYGAPLDVPGVVSVEIDDEFISDKLRGDNRTLAVHTEFSLFTGTLTLAQQSLDVLATLLDATVTDPDANTARLDFKTPKMRYFRLDGLSVNVKPPLKAVRFTLWKAKLTDAKSVVMKVDEYGEFEVEFEAFACDATTGQSLTLIYSNVDISLTTDITS